MVKGISIYGEFMACEKCDVRQYKDGTQADSELRALRIEAHKRFDTWWKTKRIKRNEAYKYLALRLQLPSGKAHIRFFNREQCFKVIKIFKQEVKK
jgi:hypothetical protein